MLAWILEHKETVLAVVAFLVAGWKAWRAGTLNTFLVERVEGLASKQDKDAIKAQAIGAGIDGLLGRVVVNAGLSSKAKKPGVLKKVVQTVLPLLLGAVLLGGCASSDPYKDALGRFGDTGAAIQPHLKPPGDPSVQALYDAFDMAVKEAQKAGGR